MRMIMALIVFFFIIMDTYAALVYEEGNTPFQCPAQSRLSCTDGGIAIIYVNGFLNRMSDVTTSSTRLEEELNGRYCELDRKGDLPGQVKVDFSYNHSASAASDIIEGAAQTLNEKSYGIISTDEAFVIIYKLFYSIPVSFTHPKISLYSLILNNIYSDVVKKFMSSVADAQALEHTDVNELKNKMKQYLEAKKKKVILVTHSQGNLIANRAIDELSSYIDWNHFRGVIGQVRVASPTDLVLAKYSRLVQNTKDVNEWLIPWSPPGNYTLDISPEKLEQRFPEDYTLRTTERLINHAFVETYLFQTVSKDPTIQYYSTSLFNLGRFTIESIFQTALKLEDYPSCGFCVEDGVPVESFRIKNEDGRWGGVVGPRATVAATAYVDFESSVCETAKVEGVAKILGASRIRGNASVTGRTTVENSLVMGEAKLADDAKVLNKSRVEGTAKVFNKGKVDRSWIFGGARVFMDGKALNGSSAGGTATIAQEGTLDGSHLRENTYVIGKAKVVGGAVLIGDAGVANTAEVTGEVWMEGEAMAIDNSRITATELGEPALWGNAIVADDGKVYDSATMSEDSYIGFNGKLREQAAMSNNSLLSDDAEMYGYSHVEDTGAVMWWSKVYGYGTISLNAHILDNARVHGFAHVHGEALLFNSAQAFGNAKVYGEAKMGGTSTASGHSEVFGKSGFYDNGSVTENAKVYGGARVAGKVRGTAHVLGTAHIAEFGVVCGSYVISSGYINNSFYCGGN